MNIIFAACVLSVIIAIICGFIIAGKAIYNLLKKLIEKL